MSRGTEKSPGNGNLRPPWKPGESGNPKGMPKGTKWGVTARLKRLLEKKTYPEVVKALKARGIEMDDASHAEAIAHSIINNALQGEHQAQKLAVEIEREEGKTLNQTGDVIYNIINYGDNDTLQVPTEELPAS